MANAKNVSLGNPTEDGNVPISTGSRSVKHYCALALGAFVAGALAIGVIAIGRVVIGRARIKKLEIDELSVNDLRVRRLWVAEKFEKPGASPER